jgi:hypothetical protein
LIAVGVGTGNGVGTGDGVGVGVGVGVAVGVGVGVGLCARAGTVAPIRATAKVTAIAVASRRPRPGRIASPIPDGRDWQRMTTQSRKSQTEGDAQKSDTAREAWGDLR